MDYSIIKVAGLTSAEAAKIVGVSKVMMWRYIKDSVDPREKYCGRPLRKRTAVFLAVLRKLVEVGKLPAKNIHYAKRMHPEIEAKRTALIDQLKRIVDNKVVESVTNT